MYPHQGNLNLDGRACVQDIRGMAESNENAESVNLSTIAMVSSPSVEEELAQLQIIDSDADESKHQNPDIAAAALSFNTNNDRQESPFKQDNRQ